MTIDLYTWATPNGRKASVMLEEVGLPYTEHAINISKGDQFEPEFLKISPNNRIPAIVDPDGPDGSPISVFETGAILIYLGEKTGKFIPTDARKRVAAMEWLMWQMGGFGPMLGQAHHFLGLDTEVPYGSERYVKESHRLYGVMDRRLADNEYLAGDEYSIADIACYPWAHRHPRHKVDISQFENVQRWYDAVGARPAVQKGMPTLGGINM
ncbi:MAG: glutathione binding-like protein [Rhodospirillaceae bacterium]|nr:glutathione binding-like protein [Rhodospirillaceae bacterium]